MGVKVTPQNSGEAAVRIAVLILAAMTLGGCIPSLTSLGPSTATAYAPAPHGSVEPGTARPAGAPATECYQDEGYGRYTSCNAMQ